LSPEPRTWFGCAAVALFDGRVDNGKAPIRLTSHGPCSARDPCAARSPAYSSLPVQYLHLHRRSARTGVPPPAKRTYLNEWLSFQPVDWLIFAAVATLETFGIIQRTAAPDAASAVQPERRRVLS